MSQATATDVDKLVMEKFVPFRERLVDVFAEKHPHIFTMLRAVFSNKDNKFGLQITESGRVTGEYTLSLDGLRIAGVEPGRLSSEIHHPFLGVIKPYIAVERATLVKAVADDRLLELDIAYAVRTYLPELTVRFLR